MYIQLINILLLTCIFTGPINSLYTVVDSNLYLIELEIADTDYRKITRAKPTRLEFDEAKISVNGIAVALKGIHTRGKTSQLQRRKSYTIELDQKVKIDFPQGPLELDAFYLISMSLDVNYFRNRLSYGCLAELGIFPLRFRYVHLKINGEHEGIYMLVQRPFDCMIDELHSPYALRRLKSGTIDKDKRADNTSDEDVEAFRQKFKQIIRDAKDLEGELLYQYLDEQIDMRSYFQWLTFNYLVRNGDYSDEIYYYIEPTPGSRRFTTMGWDFDDIFMKGPHEGIEIRDRLLGDKLLFSSEDALDRLIADDQFVYQEYLKQAKESLQFLTDQFIMDLFAQIRQELIPYFNTPHIIKASALDTWGPTDISRLEKDLDGFELYMITRKQEMLEDINKTIVD